MARLIDADILREKLLMMECMEEVVEIIDEQPTAYDVDNVVEELEHLVVYEVLDGLLAGEWIKKEQVLKIVKAGGIE